MNFPLVEPNRPFRFHPSCEDPELYVALRVTPCSAVVRSVSKKRHEEFVARTGQVVSFDKPLGSFSISPTAQVFYASQETEGSLPEGQEVSVLRAGQEAPPEQADEAGPQQERDAPPSPSSRS